MPSLDRSSALRRTAQLMKKPGQVQGREVTTEGGRTGVTGRGGNFQPLGAAAQRRLQGGVAQAAQPPKPAWRQLRDAGVAGQGSAAANRAAAAALPGQPSVGGGRMPMTFPGEPMKDPATVLAEIDRGPSIAPGVRSGMDETAPGGAPYGADAVMHELPAELTPPRLGGFAPQGASPDLLAAIRSARGSMGAPAAGGGSPSLAARLAGVMPKPQEPIGASPGEEPPPTGPMGSGGFNFLRRRPGQLGASPEARGGSGYASGAGMG
jgi:hypothetical protein